MSSNNSESQSTSSVPFGTNWTSVSEHALNSYLEASNAFFATFGFSESGPASPSEQEQVIEQPSVNSVAFSTDGWLFERSTDSFETLDVGDFVRFTKPVTETDVSAFARASGDTNRLHLDRKFADETFFEGRIAHGTLVAGTISAALARFPGMTIYLSQDLEFQNPVEIGTTVTAECELVEVLGDDQYRVRTTVEDEDETVVIDGEAVIILQEQPEAASDD